MHSNKYEILKSIFEVEGVSQRITLTPLITEEELLRAISKTKYSLTKELPCSVATTTKYLKILFPDRPSTTNRLDNYLLQKYLYKECKHCGNVKELDCFHRNSGRYDGLNSYCKVCQLVLTAVTSTKRQAKYNASKLQRIPIWVDEKELRLISAFYARCPEGFHVDHILPLNGVLVSGFHTLSNLQYLSAEDNLSKSNKYMPS